jgi:membrane associated rhomboid family serine protease
MLKKIEYNSPVVLTFAALSLLSLALGAVTGGVVTNRLFCVYRAPLDDFLTYFRFFSHVLGHSDYRHFIGNMLLLLVLGPQLEERFGSRVLFAMIASTALVSGLINFIFFPNQALLGASGIVFMMIVLSSFTGYKKGALPLTMILVFVLYIGGEIVRGVLESDNISQLTHIVGGICGGFFGYLLSGRGALRGT